MTICIIVIMTFHDIITITTVKSSITIITIVTLTIVSTILAMITSITSLPGITSIASITSIITILTTIVTSKNYYSLNLKDLSALGFRRPRSATCSPSCARSSECLSPEREMLHPGFGA